MLGSANIFSSAAAKNPDPDTRIMLSRGLRPFILRRTKSQVAKDLPEKQEQTLSTLPPSMAFSKEADSLRSEIKALEGRADRLSKMIDPMRPLYRPGVDREMAA